jgi:lysophospholipase L1-like esterase
MLDGSNPLRVIFFGDSICVGQHVSVHRGWVNQVSARLETLAARLDVPLCVANASVNGDTTRMALERMPKDVQQHGVAVLLVQFGLNDCNYWVTDSGVPRVSQAAFAANLVEIVERGYRFGARRVLLNTNHPSGRDREPLAPLGEPYERSNERYNTTVREVARSLGEKVVMTDLEAAFRQHTGGSRERLLELLRPEPDLLHLSEAGHDLYAQLLGPVLERALLGAIEGR